MWWGRGSSWVSCSSSRRRGASVLVTVTTVTRWSQGPPLTNVTNVNVTYVTVISDHHWLSITRTWPSCDHHSRERDSRRWPRLEQEAGVDTHSMHASNHEQTIKGKSVRVGLPWSLELRLRTNKTLEIRTFVFEFIARLPIRLWPRLWNTQSGITIVTNNGLFFSLNCITV